MIAHRTLFMLSICIFGVGLIAQGDAPTIGSIIMWVGSCLFGWSLYDIINDIIKGV
jgi:uncharacterized membrane protein YccC